MRSPAKNDVQVKGVGGWLSYFILLNVIISPLFTLAVVVGSYAQLEAKFPLLIEDRYYTSYKAQTLILTFCAISSLFVAGVRLWRVHKPSSVSFMIYSMWIVVIGSSFILALIGIAHSPQLLSLAQVSFDALASFFAMSIYATLWTLYLKRSKRVRNTYYGQDISSFTDPIPIRRESLESKKILNNQQHDKVLPDMESAYLRAYEKLSLDSINHGSSTSLRDSASYVEQPNDCLEATTELQEEQAYEIASLEIENKTYRKGLWVKLWTEANGNETQVKVNYIRIRVNELLKALK